MGKVWLGEDVIEGLRAVLREGPPLRLAMLFGSAATGRLRPDSDIDIAILPEDGDMPLRVELDLQVALERASGRQVDVARLDRASTLVRWEVARFGKPLWSSPPGEIVRFTAEAASEYLDFAPAFEQAAEAFRRTLASGVAESRE